jgi:hypothetical protein
LGRAILGGLLAAWPSTLLIVPSLYTVMVRDERTDEEKQGSDEDES